MASPLDLYHIALEIKSPPRTFRRMQLRRADGKSEAGPTDRTIVGEKFQRAVFREKLFPRRRPSHSNGTPFTKHAD